VETSSGDDLEHTREQSLLFASDLQVMIGRERVQREEAESAYRELSGAYLSMVRTLAEVCEAKDHHTRSHLDRTYQYATMLTQRLAPEYNQRAEIGFGYLLHDIGKVGIPGSVLDKPGPLTDDEWAIMRSHPRLGVELVKPLKFLGDAVNIVREHHGRWDGKGYPAGLRGEEIFLPARIFMMADTFDAMTSDRPYRKAMPIHAALEEIEAHAGTPFDPEVARAWCDLVEEAERTGTSIIGAVRGIA